MHGQKKLMRGAKLKKNSKASPLTPALKDFLDHVVIPALVKAYLHEKGIACKKKKRLSSVRK